MFVEIRVFEALSYSCCEIRSIVALNDFDVFSEIRVFVGFVVKSELQTSGFVVFRKKVVPPVSSRANEIFGEDLERASMFHLDLFFSLKEVSIISEIRRVLRTW